MSAETVLYKVKDTLNEHSSEILTGLGIAGFIGCAMLTGRAMLQTKVVVDEHAERMKEIKWLEDNSEKVIVEATGEHYAKENALWDKSIQYGQTIRKFIKIYALPVGLGIASAAAIISAHNHLSAEKASLAAAYSVLQQAYEGYRSRVREELGDEQDFKFASGAKTKIVKEKNKNGKKVEKKVEYIDEDSDFTPYSRWFKKGNPNWDVDPDQVMFTLETTQNHLNDLLKVRGHVFLNEVYDALGFDRTEAGQKIGWTYDPSNKDIASFIDFGCFSDEYYKKGIGGLQHSVYGMGEDDDTDISVHLDFNVDGPIEGFLRRI